MAWKRRSTTSSVNVDVDLCNFDVNELLQGIIDAGYLTETEAEAIAARKPNEFGTAPLSLAEHLNDARNEIRRHRPREALVHIEKALGNEFIGELVQL